MSGRAGGASEALPGGEYFQNRFEVGRAFIRLARCAERAPSGGRRLLQHFRYPLNTLLTAGGLAALALPPYGALGLDELALFAALLTLANSEFIGGYVRQTGLLGVLAVLPLLVLESSAYLLGMLCGVLNVAVERLSWDPADV